MKPYENINNLNPLKDKGVLIFDKEKENYFLNCKRIIDKFVSENLITLDEAIIALSIIRKKLDLPFFESKISPLSLDKITL